METSIIFAQIWGIFYIVFGLMFCINGQLNKTIEMTNDKAFVISTGYTTFFLGLVTIVIHKVYEPDWRLLITALGWITFLKGIQKIARPNFIHKAAQGFKKGQTFAGIFMFIVGAFLLWKSFA